MRAAGNRALAVCGLVPGHHTGSFIWPSPSWEAGAVIATSQMKHSDSRKGQGSPKVAQLGLGWKQGHLFPPSLRALRISLLSAGTATLEKF